MLKLFYDSREEVLPNDLAYHHGREAEIIFFDCHDVVDNEPLDYLIIEYFNLKSMFMEYEVNHTGKFNAQLLTRNESDCHENK